MSANYYAILEVNRDADDADIKASYRRLAKLRHPDKNLNNHHATTLFQQLTEAYTTLIDTEKRKAYDAQHPSTHKPRTTTQGGTSKAQTWPRSSMITAEVEIIELAVERIAKLDQKVKELSEMRKEITAHLDNLARHMNSTTLPILNELCGEERAQAEGSEGWSSFFSTLRQTKKEREERRRSAAALKRARLAKEVEYRELNNVLGNTKLNAAKIHGLINHARLQKTALETKMGDWVRLTPEAVQPGQYDSRGIRGQARAEDETAQTRMARYRAALELKETMRRQQEDPDEQTVWVFLPSD